MTAHLQDDGFHEIQLNGKQLVFLFMAATVVSVVIFLCGVLVGRGVRTERTALADTTAAAVTEPAPSPQPTPSTPQAATPLGSDPRTAAAPPAPADDLSYFNRLEKTTAARDDLKADTPIAKSDKPAEKAAPAPPVEKRTAPPAKPSTPVSDAPAAVVAAVLPVAAAPSGPGYAVQVAALNVRIDADAIAKRLTSKGYAAYVLAPASGTPQVFRVRVGKFPTRREAESIATKLQKEEQFKPWVTR